MAALIPCGHSKLANHESNNIFNKLCDELLGEILVRLPTTAAVRFQAVSKRWYSLISSPYFIARFRHHHTYTDVESSLLFRFAHRCNCTQYSGGCDQCQSRFQIISDSSLLRNLYGESVFRLSYLPCSPTHLHKLRLEGSFADLILCSCINMITLTSEIDYYISNPLTRQWIDLPPAACEGSAEFVSIGFLCVEDNTSHHKKFAVVRLCTGRYSATCNPRSQFKAQVFSSENWLWRTLYVSSTLTLKHYTGRTPLVAYRGMLHWLNGDCIVVYDPLNTPERFSRVIHLPIQLSRYSIFIYNCFGVSQGCLRVAEVSDGYTIDPILDVWELEDYDSGLWILVHHKIHLRDLIHNGLLENLQSELRHFSVLSFHPENGDVIYLRLLNNGVVHVNMKSRIIERIYPINERAMFSWSDAFHLVDQPWPTSVSLLH